MSELGKDIKKLGFGLMRLPAQDQAIDVEQVKKMVDKFMAAGFSYFDTAYVYGNGASENAARDALVKRYPRDSFQLADKMPLFHVKSEADYEPLFRESLERAGVDYFDFYLMHNMSGDAIQKVEETNGWAFMRGLKESGRAKHIGFSFHGTPEDLDGVLTRHPEVEFVQLQVNYADWENPDVRSRECVETCRKHGKPIVIMEPVKGGSLAGLNNEIRGIFTKANPEASIPSWAIRYAASIDGVITVLSGMSNEAQMEDNISYMKDFQPLTDEERGVIAEALEAMAKIPQIPCTGCRYCVDDCPMQINIPGFFRTYNTYLMFAGEQSFKNGYARTASRGGKASDCVECGSCEEHCPQHLEIRDLLKKIAAAAE